MSTLPNIQTLNRLEQTDFGAAITLLFESAPPLVKALFESRPYDKYYSLIDSAKPCFEALNEADQILVINAHPRIGENKATLSALSYQEQGYGNAPSTDRDQIPAKLSVAQEADFLHNEKVHKRLAELNAAYEHKYGFKFIVFVNGRPREEIIPLMENRIENSSKKQEIETAITDMAAIAHNRLKKLEVEGRVD